jgi:hypothetical protein
VRPNFALDWAGLLCMVKRSNIPQTALVAKLDTYDFNIILFMSDVARALLFTLVSCCERLLVYV